MTDKLLTDMFNPTIFESNSKKVDRRNKVLEFLQMFSIRVLRNKVEKEEFFLDDDVLVSLILHYSQYDVENIGRYIFRDHVKALFYDEEYELILIP